MVLLAGVGTSRRQAPRCRVITAYNIARIKAEVINQLG
jgi:hypothetical protein